MAVLFFFSGQPKKHAVINNNNILILILIILIFLIVTTTTTTAAEAGGGIFMIIEYDTNGTARPVMSLNFTLRTVELHVTVLGCDHGYYADEEKRPALVCRECLCNDDDNDALFLEGRSEAFVEEDV
jgi:hypothetical protein